MIIQYQSTLDEAVEPTARLCLRAKSWPRQRLTTAAVIATFVTFFCVFLVLHFAGQHLPPGPIINAAIQHPFIAWAFVWAIVTPVCACAISDASVRKNLKRQFNDSYGDQLPATATYRIDGEKLTTTFVGITTTVSLADLNEVTADPEFLEISFMPKGFCVLPRRAFSSSAEMDQFITLLKAPRNASLEPSTVAA